ncbi:hypothetical protein J2Z23_003569 [Lederbergia galactosidilyticus]|nr:hypothetical protein [Lederbergia galactosidilytica]
MDYLDCFSEIDINKEKMIDFLFNKNAGDTPPAIF